MTGGLFGGSDLKEDGADNNDRGTKLGSIFDYGDSDEETKGKNAGQDMFDQ